MPPDEKPEWCSHRKVLHSTNVGPFLQWDPAVLPAAPVGYIGDPAVLHPIIGSTFPDNNKFRLEGPNIGGPGVNAIENNLFVIIGKKFTGVVPPPLTVNRASYVRPSAASAQVNVFAQSSGAATLVSLRLVPVGKAVLGALAVIHLTNQRSIACPHQTFTHPNQAGGNTPQAVKATGGNEPCRPSRTSRTHSMPAEGPPTR